MSTRYIKKVYGDDILEKGDENASDVEIPITGNVKSKSYNVFDLLHPNSESDAKEEDDGDETSTSNIKRKKRKKRKRRVEGVKVSQKSDSESNGNADEIDRTVREINKLLGEPSPSCSNEENANTQNTNEPVDTMLTVHHKHLNPFNELKRIFGNKTIQAEQNKRRSRGRLSTLKKTWLISARESWPPINKFGLSMSLDHSMESNGNVQYFVYEHAESYRQIQYKFLQAVESLDPENIINIINMHPYHVDALLQLAELLKLSEDLAMAAEFTERALYCLECAFHPLFNVTTGNCRLDYRKQQNRALFITLFKHLDFVGGRACYRTSLEFCKFLLSLDPEGDPLAIVLSIDFYALRAKEYKWFIKFCEYWDKKRNLTQLPNIACSLALAMFHVDQESANESLENALIMFPGILLPLLHKCSIQPDAKVIAHSYFNSTATATTSSALEKLQNLYIERSFHLWKEPNTVLWLEQCVHKVLERVDSQDSHVGYCQTMRGKRYQGKLPRNILRHIILSDIKDVVVNVEEIQREGPVLSHDPLPPVDSIDIYRKPTANTRPIQSTSNLFSIFFSSLFMDVEGAVAAAVANGLNLFEENEDNN